MIYEKYQTALLYVCVIAAIFIGGRLFMSPLKWGAKLLLNVAIAIAALALTNWAGGTFGFFIGINFVSVALCALLGIPGYITLVILQIIGL